MNGPWEDFQKDEGPWSDFQEKPAQAPSAPSQSLTEFAESQIPLAARLPLKAERGVRQLFDKGGEAVAENLAGGGLKPLNIPGVPLPLFQPAQRGEAAIRTSPEVAARIGFGIQMMPDMASSAPGAILKAQGVAKSAVPLARRALGFSKQFLKTPFARGQATKTAETALREGVIPLSGNPQTMFDRASALKEKAGQKIGKVLEETPAQLEKAFDDLEMTRAELTKGMQKGVFSTASKAIDDIQTNVLELMTKRGYLTADKLNAIKDRLGKSINYMADIASQTDNKAIQNRLANSIRDMVKQVVSPQEFMSFLKNQKLYNAAKLMVKGLDNEVAGQMGNKMISPYSAVAGGAQLAAGQPGQAAASLGITEGLMRRGAGTGAKLIQDVHRISPGIGYGAALGANRLFQNRRETKPLFK